VSSQDGRVIVSKWCEYIYLWEWNIRLFNTLHADRMLKRKREHCHSSFILSPHFFTFSKFVISLVWVDIFKIGITNSQLVSGIIILYRKGETKPLWWHWNWLCVCFPLLCFLFKRKRMVWEGIRLLRHNILREHFQDENTKRVLTKSKRDIRTSVCMWKMAKMNAALK